MEVYSTDPDYVYQYKAYMWKKNGFMLDLGGLPGETSHYARAVNDCGQIVGNSITSTLSGGSAWIWENGGPLQNLNKLVLSNIGWHLSYPTAINNKGQILGQASDGWNWTAFVLTPTLPQCNATLAYDPTPADGATGTRINLTLTWRSGNGAVEHDVYFGTNANAVADANHSSPEFKGTTSNANYNPGALSYNTWYYWRIDEIGGTCSREGEVWSFMTGGTTPVAEFFGSPTSGISPLIVNFRDTSQGGSITAWNWNFGDSSSSTTQNPAHTYNSAGIYTVALTATGPGGNNTKTKTNYINVIPPPPNANFTASQTVGYAPLNINFTDQSTGIVTAWSWTFGDGGSSTAQNPTHIYNNAGTYTVSLTVSNGGGSDNETKTNYITVYPEPSGFTDDFNRADSTTLGNGWTEVQGDLKILSNEVRNEAIKIYHMAVQISLSGTYQDVACDFAKITSTACRFGVVLRYQDSQNYYWIYRSCGGTSALRISKVVNGTETVLTSVSQSSPGNNVWFEVEGIADGTTLKLKLNGVEKLSITDTTFSSGSCGILFGPTSNTDSHRADNFTATIGSL